MTPREIAKVYNCIAVISDDECSKTHFVFLGDGDDVDDFRNALVAYHHPRILDILMENNDASVLETKATTVRVTWCGI